VSDGGGQTMPMVNQPSNWSVGGRGLGIVDRLSLRWGVCMGAAEQDGPVESVPGETTVWAELPVRYGSSAGLVIASSRDA
jgi:hypothetical protein